MLNKAEMRYRMNYAREHGIPMTNYGMLIAHVQGVLERAIAPFPSARLAWEELESN
jgi:hypothetical protein